METPVRSQKRKAEVYQDFYDMPKEAQKEEGVKAEIEEYALPARVMETPVRSQKRKAEVYQDFYDMPKEAQKEEGVKAEIEEYALPVGLELSPPKNFCKNLKKEYGPHPKAILNKLIQRWIGSAQKKDVVSTYTEDGEGGYNATTIVPRLGPEVFEGNGETKADAEIDACWKIVAHYSHLNEGWVPCMTHLKKKSRPQKRERQRYKVNAAGVAEIARSKHKQFLDEQRCSRPQWWKDG
eukprot:TRINITY_DN17506_c0_g1_i1.p1 TRINITY_DN17506_c0_g1~~TRINITY_DN17506_c0_g1_i1.p1  ORF type:complete len:248 (+),score=70.06 TRINITY_DN17506_c0_g1_i1:32-745(+)